MTNSIITRGQNIVVTSAVLATLVLVGTRVTAGSIEPGACPAHASSAATLASYQTVGSGGCAGGSSPVGYRMP